MSATDFYANATLGFRQWYLSAGEPSALRGMANPLLHGLARHGFNASRYRWSVDEANHAECARLENSTDSQREAHGEVPGTECSCGFYAYGRRFGTNSETTVHLVGGVIAAWGNLELHERGFRCSAAKILALFEPSPGERRSDDEDAPKTWTALGRLCTEHTVPLLGHDALRDEGAPRRYALERGLVLLDDQIKEAA